MHSRFFIQCLYFDNKHYILKAHNICQAYIVGIMNGKAQFPILSSRLQKYGTVHGQNV
jgi:hypothetical protein